MASPKFWWPRSTTPFSYALAALEASAPVTGLERSVPSLLLLLQASAAAQKRRALLVLNVIFTIPLDSQRPGRSAGPMSLGDQGPQQPPPLAVVRGGPSPQSSPQ